MHKYKEIAIVAPTASGKTDLSINIAKKIDAVILSLDSLSLYKEIDIASAKPTLEEQNGIIHFGIDKIFPNEDFGVIDFIQEYKNAKEYAKKHQKHLIIVGGTGFYLKSLLTGLSKTPIISKKTKLIVKEKLYNLADSYHLLTKVDKDFMLKIKATDRYRIEKALEIFYETNLPPSQYFNLNKPTPIINKIDIFEIKRDKDILRARIKLRTQLMLKNGLIDEVIYLEKLYKRNLSSMKSIGIVETLDYLDGKIDKKQLEEQIFFHTSQLAKRQRTFNNSQFSNIFSENNINLEKKILSMV